MEIKIRRLVFVEKEHEMSDTWDAHGIRLDVLHHPGEKGGANMFMTFEQKLKDEAFVARQKGLEEGEKTGEKKGRMEGYTILSTPWPH